MTVLMAVLIIGSMKCHKEYVFSQQRKKKSPDSLCELPGLICLLW